ncbi:MAG TPA: TIGR02301 family protein [Hyphomicrobiaceae bacterium]|nr:TIGR02301 family protein [Hyphomicrobiaceae bacterium]
MGTGNMFRAALLIILLLVLVASAPHRLLAQDTKPYDDRLLRLSEILGAVHYLRELCGANEGQLWRDRMRELLDSEGTSALRRAKLTRSFNQGYNSYSRTYRACTPTAQTAISRFLTEGEQIADGLVRTIP